MSDPQARPGSSPTHVPASMPKPTPTPSPAQPAEPRPAAPLPAAPHPAPPRAASPHPAGSGPLAPSARPGDDPSGNAHIDAIMARLDELEHKPLPAHVEVFDAIQGGLAAHLSHDQD